jgi:hypothetical protein
MLVGWAKSSFLQDSIKRAASRKKERKKERKKKVNTALFCFMKGFVLRNSIQLGTTRPTICNFFSTGLRSTN